MFLRLLLRFLLPAALGAALAFLTLAFAIEYEPVYTTASLIAISPGLQAAELLTPAKHESMASTVGGFLRVALAVNFAYYIAILAVFAYLIDRLVFRRPNSKTPLQN